MERKIEVKGKNNAKRAKNGQKLNKKGCIRSNFLPIAGSGKILSSVEGGGGNMVFERYRESTPKRRGKYHLWRVGEYRFLTK